MIGGMDIIYPDEIFFRNAALDYLLLLCAARLRSAPLRRGRFALGAALGGLYAAAAALPPWRVLASGPGAVGASLALCAAAYGRRGFWRSWGTFLGLSAAFAGGVYALGRLAGESGGVITASPRVLLTSFGLGYGAVRLLYGRRRREGRRIVETEVRLRGRKAVFPALRDTGNELLDPATGRGVLVAEAEALAALFTPPLALPLPGDALDRFRALAEHPSLRGRLRLVGFSALGTERGMLCCFRPDTLTADGERLDHLVAFAPGSLAGEDYRAIL